MKRPPKPTETELQVLGLLWENGPATARQVLEQLPDRKPRAYTTVLTILQVMEKKGLVDHTTEGKTHVYRARVKRQPVLGKLLRGLTRNAFSGRPSSVVQCLLESDNVGQTELAEIRRLLDAHDRAHREDPDQ
jgi:predicted transcriptional regulator